MDFGLNIPEVTAKYSDGRCLIMPYNEEGLVSRKPLAFFI